MSHCSLCGGSGWEGRCDCDPDGQYHCRGMGTCGTHECPACGEEGFLTEPISLAKLALRFSRVERATFHEDGVRPETDSDHTVMLGLVACQLAPQAHAAQHEKLSAEYPEFSVTLGLLRESMDYAESCWRDQ